MEKTLSILASVALGAFFGYLVGYDQGALESDLCLEIEELKARITSLEENE
jgi:hypothetical protein